MTEMFGQPQTSTPTMDPIGSSPITTPGGSNAQSTKDTAKEEAQGVAQEGVQGGKHVAAVAADQAKEVVSEAGNQAQALLAEAKSELLDQAASQKKRVQDQLHALAQELGSMARTSDQAGLASALAGQASRQLGTLAQWVSEREPGSLLTELKDFARSKPGTFLATAAGIGLVAGRMTRGATAGPPEDQASEPPAALPGIPAVPVQGGRPAAVSSLGAGGELPDLSPAAPAVGVGSLYPSVVNEEPLPTGAPGMAP